MPRKGLTHPRVVAEAAALADEVGLEQLTFAALAKRLGISAPALYKHVDGLERLRRDLAVLALTELLARIREAAVGKAEREALAAVAESYRRYAHERPGLVTAVLRAPSPGDREHSLAGEALVAVLRQVVAGYNLSADEEVHAIRSVRAILHGFTSLESAGGFGLSQSVDDTYSRLIDALHRSLADPHESTR